MQKETESQKHDVSPVELQKRSQRCFKKVLLIFQEIKIYNQIDFLFTIIQNQLKPK